MNTSPVKNNKAIRSTLQALAWIAGIACLIYAVSFLVRRSYDIMKTNTREPGYITCPDVKIENGKMTPEVLLAFGKVTDPQISPDGAFILYNVSYTSIRKNRSCANLYICNADGSGRQQLTASAHSISNARWCDGGKKIIYLRDGQIWIAGLRHGKKGWSLRNEDRISDIPAGIREFKLSPDQTRLMYTSTVKSGVNRPSDLYKDLKKSDAIITDDLMYRHWDHWVTELPHTFIADINVKSPKSKGIRKENSTDILANEKGLYELPAEPFSGIEQLAWSPDGKTIAYSCKKLEGKEYAFSTDSEIYLYDVASGSCTRIVMGGGYDTCPVWSPDGRKLCWLSMERDGYEADKQRLMVADIDWKIQVGEEGKRLPMISGIRDLTDGFKYNAADPVWDSSSEKIYFNALAEGLQGIFVADMTGDGSIERVTGDDLWYDFSSPFHISSGDGVSRGHHRRQYGSQASDFRKFRTSRPAGRNCHRSPPYQDS